MSKKWNNNMNNFLVFLDLSTSLCIEKKCHIIHKKQVKLNFACQVRPIFFNSL